jgi:hypothetical protein
MNYGYMSKNSNRYNTYIGFINVIGGAKSIGRCIPE